MIYKKVCSFWIQIKIWLSNQRENNTFMLYVCIYGAHLLIASYGFLFLSNLLFLKNDWILYFVKLGYFNCSTVDPITEPSICSRTLSMVTII